MHSPLEEKEIIFGSQYNKINALCVLPVGAKAFNQIYDPQFFFHIIISRNGKKQIATSLHAWNMWM